MESGHKKILLERQAESNARYEKYLYFKYETKASLFLGQLQFLQTLGGIGLALLGIGFATETFKPEGWALLSLTSTALLILYVSAYSRESIDSQDKGLDIGEEKVENTHSAFHNAITAAIQKDDIAIYYKELGTKFQSRDAERQEDEPQYQGEIALMLFYASLCFGLLAVTHVIFNAGAAIGITVLVTVFALTDWSLSLTKYLSKFLRLVTRGSVGS